MNPPDDPPSKCPKLHSTFSFSSLSFTQTLSVSVQLPQSLSQTALVVITCFILCLTSPHSTSLFVPAPLAVISISTQGPSVGPSGPVSHHKNKQFERGEIAASDHLRGRMSKQCAQVFFGGIRALGIFTAEGVAVVF